MFCTSCGVELADTARFCSQCGSPTPNTASSGGFQRPVSSGRLSRPEEGKKLAGVCAGFARYFGLDVTLVRVIWLILCFWPPFAGVLAYIVCWIVMPKDPLPVVGAAQSSTAS